MTLFSFKLAINQATGKITTDFFSAHVPSQAEVKVARKEREGMGGPKGKLNQQWCQIVASKLAEANPYCSVTFKKGWIKKLDSRKTSLVCFRAWGHCAFTDCTISFHVTIQSPTVSYPPPTLQMEIAFSGQVLHRRGERRAGTYDSQKEKL